MRKFYEDSSQAKTFTNQKMIAPAMRQMRARKKYGYELRRYHSRGFDTLAIYADRRTAECAKAFKEVETGDVLAIVYTGYRPAYNVDFDMASRSL